MANLLKDFNLQLLCFTYLYQDCNGFTDLIQRAMFKAKR